MSPNQLQFEISGQALASLKAIGTLPGVKILAVGGLCGQGAGYLQLDGDGLLAWAAPGDGFGVGVAVPADGTYLLASASANKWIQVQVYVAYLPGPSSAGVVLSDIYDGQAVFRDATAAEAAAGDVQTWTINLHNTSSGTVGGLGVYLDPFTHDSLQISLDGATWSRPLTQGAGLAIASITAGSSATVHIRRTLAVGSPSAAFALLGLRVAWTSPAAAATMLRGRFRIFNAACYRIYRRQDRPPVEGDTPWATAGTLPSTPAGTFADGTWYLSVSYFNGIFDSGFLPIGPRGETFNILTVSGGAAVAALPVGPLDWTLAELSGGVVQVVAADAVPPLDPLIVAGTLQWAIFYQINGGAWTEIQKPYTSGGLAALSCTLSAQAAGTVVAVRLRVRRNDGTPLVPVWVYSLDVAAQTVIIGTGPTAPLDAVEVPAAK